ncbi:hypothetical protein M3Y94_00899200 [Aphelenchoides besseyi]|nr:hypothetical protein M3Y94_00899200 [Aphelenchoides besseyi]KAI6223367.1 hypothetical protein M3Y95_00882800 [Aphelenchoides besseyi]
MLNSIFLLLFGSAVLVSAVPSDPAKSYCEHDPHSQLVIKSECPNLGRISSNSTEAKIQVFANVKENQEISIEIKGCKFTLFATPEGFEDMQLGAVYDSPLTFISANDSVIITDMEASDSCATAAEDPMVVDIEFLYYEAGIEIKFDPTVIWFYEQSTLMDNPNDGNKDEPKPWVYVVIAVFVIFCLIPSIVFSCISSFCRAILPCC